ncbi:hypothetical protein OROMI_031127 [Orobanche minor]
MDLMKVFDQTVREIKREVNLKVLKVPEIEQKVLDATDDEPWGPHGTVLAEIARATNKLYFLHYGYECALDKIDRDWQELAFCLQEYLVAHGSERAVDDIIEHTFQISSLASFEYVEPSGKDVGINVRKKAETIVALLNNKDKIQEVRNKAATNREKYVGLSSSGITYKSGAASFSSTGFKNNDRYGGFGNRGDDESFKSSYNKNTDQYGEDKYEKTTKSKKVPSSYDSTSQNSPSKRDKYASVTSQNAPSDKYDEDFDDFDPRGTSSAQPSSEGQQVDLFGPDFVGDLLDAPIGVPTDKSTSLESDSSEVDLFADATFVSATPPPDGAKPEPQGLDANIETDTHPELLICNPNSTGRFRGPNLRTCIFLIFICLVVLFLVLLFLIIFMVQLTINVDLFASQPAPPPPAVSTPMDFFAASDPPTQLGYKAPKSDAVNSLVDPFAEVPLNKFDESDPFGAFTSHADPLPTADYSNCYNDVGNGNVKGSSTETKAPAKSGFQVKSGIWADSLSRGLIDLDITAPKKVNLADVGIVGGLSDHHGSDEKDKGSLPSFYMGNKSMGVGSQIGKSGFTSSTTTTTINDDFFSSLSSSQYQFGSFQK